MSVSYHHTLLRRIDFDAPTPRTEQRRTAVSMACKRLEPKEVLDLLDLALRGTDGAGAARLRDCVAKTDTLGEDDVGFAELQILGYLAVAEMLSRDTRSSGTLALAVMTAPGTGEHLPGAWTGLAAKARKRLGSNMTPIPSFESLLAGLDSLPGILDLTAAARTKGERQGLAASAKDRILALRKALLASEAHSSIDTWTRIRAVGAPADLLGAYHAGNSLLDLCSGISVGYDQLRHALSLALPSNSRLQLETLDQAKVRSRQMEEQGLSWLCPVHSRLGGRQLAVDPGECSPNTPAKVALQVLLERFLLDSTRSREESK